MTAPSQNFMERFAQVSAQVASMQASSQKTELRRRLAALRPTIDRLDKAKTKAPAVGDRYRKTAK